MRRIVAMASLYFLERDLAVQLDIAGDKDLAQAALRVWPQDAEARAGGGRRAREGGGRVWVIVRPGLREMRDAGLNVRVGDLLEFAANRVRRADCGEALLWIVAVLGNVHIDHHVDHVAHAGRQGAGVDENLAQRLAFVEDPRVHTLDQGITADEVHLQRKDAEEQIAIGGRGHGTTPVDDGTR